MRRSINVRLLERECAMSAVSEQLQGQILAVVREAGVLSRRWFDGQERNEVSYKGATDIVSIADREVEAFLRRRLKEILPDAGMLGEEGTDTRLAGVRHFIVDPIDGTGNFVRGLPYYAIVVALKEEERTVFGAVHAPVLDWTYHATLGGGAWKNGRRLCVSHTDQMIQAIAAMGFACIRGGIKPDSLPILNEAVYRVQGLRRLGSAALDLCLVAEGKLDLYWEIGIYPWDIVAGILILQEAGGRVTDLAGGDGMETLRQVLGSNGRLHDEFLELIRSVRAG